MRGGAGAKVAVIGEDLDEKAEQIAPIKEHPNPGVHNHSQDPRRSEVKENLEESEPSKGADTYQGGRDATNAAFKLSPNDDGMRNLADVLSLMAGKIDAWVGGVTSCHDRGIERGGHRRDRDQYDRR